MANPKILVVDDEPDVVEMFERTLRSEGFEVVSAYDGIGAMDLASTERPDLVLLDVMMPMMSGYEVCAQLRANPNTQHIPVICISSAHSPDARANALRAGAATLLTKPVMPRELIAQIRRYLRTNETA